MRQIVTGLSNGQIKVLYSPTQSLNGAKLLLQKSAKKVTIEEASRAFMQAPILTPHALPMFRDDAMVREGGAGGKRKRDKERMDKRKTRRPEAPVTGPGRGGRVGASATQHVVQSLVRDTTRDEDVSIIFLIGSLRVLDPESSHLLLWGLDLGFNRGPRVFPGSLFHTGLGRRRGLR